jgi:signal transduction histidine kinase
VTDRRHAQENQVEHRTVMAHSLRTLSMAEMATTIAHELNQPLTEIVNYSRGAVRFLQSRPDARDRIIDSLTIVSGEAERAAEILRNIRNFLRKEPPRWERKDVNLLVNAMLTILQAELRGRAITLDVVLEPGLPEIDVVAIEIEQVILNLARNAIEAMASVVDRPKVLSITTHYTGRGVDIVIGDTGTGLPPLERGDVFDPFFTTKPDGLGMGLAITRSIVEAHGGDIWVERTSDLGTTITFSLPSANGPQRVH